jgi:hypothetical protein
MPAGRRVPAARRCALVRALHRPGAALSTQQRGGATLAGPPLRSAAPHFIALQFGFSYCALSDLPGPRSAAPGGVSGGRLESRFFGLEWIQAVHAFVIAVPRVADHAPRGALRLRGGKVVESASLADETVDVVACVSFTTLRVRLAGTAATVEAQERTTLVLERRRRSPFKSGWSRRMRRIRRIQLALVAIGRFHLIHLHLATDGAVAEEARITVCIRSTPPQMGARDDIRAASSIGAARCTDKKQPASKAYDLFWTESHRHSSVVYLQAPPGASPPGPPTNNQSSPSGCGDSGVRV